MKIFELFEGLGARKGGGRDCIGLEQFKASYVLKAKCDLGCRKR